MDLDRLAAERSLAFHSVIAARSLDDPAILETARHRVEEWVAENPERPFIKEWARILAGDAKSVADFLVDKGERATELRQSSPFAGVLNARDRWRIWSDTKESLEGEA
jgi:hypothetical protein